MIKGLAILALAGVVGCGSTPQPAPETEPEIVQRPAPASPPGDRSVDQPEDTESVERSDEAADTDDTDEAVAAPPPVEESPAPESPLFRWEPPTAPVQREASAAQRAALGRYYRIRRSPHLRVVTAAAVVSAAREYVEDALRAALTASGVAASAFRANPRPAARVEIRLGVGGEDARSEKNVHGRAIVSLTLIAGPVGTEWVRAELRGPWRLSRVSATDAVLSSLQAIPVSAWESALDELERRWRREVASAGIPYRVAAADKRLEAALAAVGRRERGNLWRIFETPPEIERILADTLNGVPYVARVDEARGSITIVAAAPEN